MADKHICVAIYATHDQADEAFSRLQAEGSDMDLLSFVGRDYWPAMMGSRNAGERFLYRGALGPFWERMWSSLRGWGVFWFFENGPVLVAGPLVRTIIATQEEGNGHRRASGFEAALTGIGIPKESLVEYEKALLNDQVLVFVQGTFHEINQAQGILEETKAINHTIHHAAAI
jgi:hypothetical protein